jgi:ribonuclease HI
MSNTIVGGLNFLQWNARSLLPKKQHLLDLIRENNIHVIALCETWLQNSDCLYIPGFEVIRRDRPDGRGGGVLLGVRKDIGFRQTPIAQVNSCEMIAADLEITGVQGDCLHIASAYFPPDCRLNSVELSAALRELGSPMLIFGDFNAQSQSWGCEQQNNRALVLQTTIDDLSLVFLNDGSLTRIASPPFRSSAVDMTLCSAGLSFDCAWHVLDDLGGSDHLPIVTSLSSISVPILLDIPAPIFDLTRHLDWHQFSDRVLEAMVDTPDPLNIEEKYALFVNIIRSAALAAQKHPPRSGFRFPLAPAIWWDEECAVKKDSVLGAFRLFRNNGNIINYESYIENQRDFQNLCRKKKTESWRLYCSTLNFQTRLSDVWKMAKRFRNPRSSSGGAGSCGAWMSTFVDKITPPFVPCKFEVQNQSAERFPWLAQTINISELNAALDICNNTSPGEDGIKFSLLKNLPGQAKLFLLQIFNEIMDSGEVPLPWHRTKIVPILKPGKDANSADSYRPISLLSCIRKLFEKIILTRLEYWAEKYEMLSKSQYGFRKGHGTRDCLAILTTDIQISFERKQQTLVGFLDITGAYDNVLIDLLCEQMFQAQVPAKLVNVMWSLLNRKEMLFYVDGKVMATSVGYKGLPQGSSLSPFSYSFYTSEVDYCLPANCSLVQYADDLAVYSSDAHANCIQNTIQIAINLLDVFFSNIGLSISEKKSELVFFSRKHTTPIAQIGLNGRLLTVSNNFRYLGVIFDQKLLWNAHVRLVQQKCAKRINLMRSMAGVSWGAHPDTMIVLYKGLIRSVLEYGCIAFDRAADTHILKLERIQYRCLRIALGLMQSTHVQTVEIIARIEPLRLRYSMLNQRFLTSVFSNETNPLKAKLCSLKSMQSPKIIREFDIVNSFNLQATASVYNPPLDALLFVPKEFETVKEQLANHRKEEYHQIASNIVSSATSQLDKNSIIFTDGSRSEGETGFGVYHFENFVFGLRLHEPSGVFTSELTAILHALIHIKTHPPGQFLIMTDSMSSIAALQSQIISPKTHPLVYDCKEAFWILHGLGYEINIGWVPSHVGVGGNERVDQIAKNAAAGLEYSGAAPRSLDYFPLAKSRIFGLWQNKWDQSDMGRYTYSVFPTIPRKPWFTKLEAERRVITAINRMISNHTCLNTHLYRIGIKDSQLCPCNEDYETLDHVMWACVRFRTERRHMVSELARLDIPIYVPVRDLLGGRYWKGLQICCSFLKKCGLSI